MCNLQLCFCHCDTISLAIISCTSLQHANANVCATQELRRSSSDEQGDRTGDTSFPCSNYLNIR